MVPGPHINATRNPLFSIYLFWGSSSDSENQIQFQVTWTGTHD